MKQASHQLTIDLSLQEIYDALCPDCKDRLLEMMSRKANLGMLKGALRAQLESPSSVRPEPVEG